MPNWAQIVHSHKQGTFWKYWLMLLLPTYYTLSYLNISKEYLKWLMYMGCLVKKFWTKLGPNCSFTPKGNAFGKLAVIVFVYLLCLTMLCFLKKFLEWIMKWKVAWFCRVVTNAGKTWKCWKILELKIGIWLYLIIFDSLTDSYTFDILHKHT